MPRRIVISRLVKTGDEHRPGILRHAVALVKPHAEGCLHLSFHGHVQRRTTRIEIAQRRSVQAGSCLFQVLKHPGKERRNPLKSGYALMLQNLEQTLRGEAPIERQACAGVQRGQQDGGKAEDMCQWQHTIDSIRRPQATGGAGDAGEMQKPMMAHHHAFRRPGGPGGIEQGGDIASQHLILARHLARRRQHGEAREELIALPGRSSQPERMGLRISRHDGTEQHKARLAVFAYRLDLTLAQSRIHVDRPSPQFDTGEYQRHLLYTVLRNQHDPVAAGDPRLSQATCRQHNCIPQLGVGQLPLGIAQGRGGAPMPCPNARDVADSRRILQEHLHRHGLCLRPGPRRTRPQNALPG
ncbi:hypothetical protein D3C85_736890 [compost metagenome]